MKKRQLFFKVEPLTAQNSFCSIRVDCNNQYFFKNLLPHKLQYSASLSENYTTQQIGTGQLFKPKNSNAHRLNHDVSQLQLVFKQILQIYVPGEQVNLTWDSIKQEIKKDRNSHILGGKKYLIEEDLYKQGDYVFFARRSIKEFIKHMKTYELEEGLLFSLDQILNRNKIVNGHREVARIIIKEMEEKIKKESFSLDIRIQEIALGQSQIPKRPKVSLNFSVFGDMNNIHELYLQIGRLITHFIENCIQIQQQSFLQKRLNRIGYIFEETRYGKKVYKTSQKSILIFKQGLSSEQINEICRQLSMEEWDLNINDGFTQEDIEILSLGQENRQFKSYMQQKRIFVQKISFAQNNISIVCDVKTKDMFIKESTKYLNTFEKESKVCSCFQNLFEIHVFNKYYFKQFTTKFRVQFHLQNNTLIRKNFSKYSQEIDNELKNVKEKMAKKFIKLVIGKHIQQSTQILFLQVKNPTGYTKNQLGCKLYSFGRIRIKVKQIQSLKTPQQILVYPIDETLNPSSIFRQIIAPTSINFESFLANANKKKNPIKLIQKFEKTVYSNITCLFNASNQSESALVKNIQDFLSLFEQSVSLSIMEHHEDYYWYVLENLIVKIQKVLRSNGKGNETIDVNLYYEGGDWAFKIIKDVLSHLQAKIKTQFYLEQQDLHKIYALQYNKLTILPCQAPDNSHIEHLSPIIAFLLNYETTVQKKRLIFSYFPRASVGVQESQQLFEYVVNLKTDEIIESIIECTQPMQYFSPYIKKVEQVEEELKRIISLIKLYYISEYIVISAVNKTDGKYGNDLSFSTHYLMGCAADKGKITLDPVSVDIGTNKIVHKGNKPRAKLRQNHIKQWSEITTYTEEKASIISQLQ